MNSFARGLGILLLASASSRLGAQRPNTLPALLTEFDSVHDASAKERLLRQITEQGSKAAPALLRIAQTTANPDTRWMAMRGMATLGCAACAPFLESSLKDSNEYVRANAARALGDLRIAGAAADILAAFTSERKRGAIEQESLALRLLRVSASAPNIREKIPEYTGQTRLWLIQALGTLGNRSDVPLIASYLDEDASDIAAQAIEDLTGVSFGPRPGPGLRSVPSSFTLAAQAWWKSHQDAWPHCEDCRVP